MLGDRAVRIASSTVSPYPRTMILLPLRYSSITEEKKVHLLWRWGIPVTTCSSSSFGISASIFFSREQVHSKRYAKVKQSQFETVYITKAHVKLTVSSMWINRLTRLLTEYTYLTYTLIHFERLSSD